VAARRRLRLLESELARVRPRALRRAAARREWLAGAAQRRARVLSRTAYRGLSPGSAAALLKRDFGRDLAHQGATPAGDPVVRGHVLRYLDPYEAVVRSGSGRRLVLSGTPLAVTGVGHRLLPVDMALAASGTGFAPVNSPFALLIGSRSGAGVVVGSGGVRVVPEGADVAGELVGSSSVFYPDIATDADAEVGPTADGVSLNTTIRSPLAPETFAYRVASGPGASLVGMPGGGAEVVRAGSVLARIGAPSAVDAQGSPVPVSMSVQGADSLVMRVAHREGEFDYPILVDPEITVEYGDGGGSWIQQQPAIAANDGQYVELPDSVSASSGPYIGDDGDGAAEVWKAPDSGLPAGVQYSYTLFGLNMQEH
jgi:hypothetical protein